MNGRRNIFTQVSYDNSFIDYTVREGGGGDSLARRPRADGRCTSPVSLPCTLPPDGFERATAGYVDRPQTGWGPVIGRERLMITPPPSRSRRRSNSDDPGKSLYSGEIDYRFLTFQTGNRF